MNRKKLAVLLIAVGIVLSGCNVNGGNDPTEHSTPYNSDSQASEQNDAEETSATPENTEESVPDTKGTEETTSDADNTDETSDTADTDDTEDTDKTDESGVTSDSENDTTTTTKSAPVTTTTTAVTTTTTSATTTTTAATTTTTTTAATTTQPASGEPSPPIIYATTADGKLTSSTSKAIIDYSNTSDGYIMAKYTGSVSKAIVQITYPNGTKYNYNLNTKGNYEAFCLTGGNGSYSVLVGENTSGNNYAVAASCTISVKLSSSTAPYLRPSQYVDFSKGDAAVTKASQLCAGATTSLQKIERIYSWVVENVNYDNALANDVKNKKVTSYVASPTKIINEKKGICYDYAVGMAAMLRSQGIPTQVVFGNVTNVGYHAWINVYTSETGWVCGAIYFDGSSWKRMDATIASSNRNNKAIYDFINNNSNYYSVEKLY